MNPTACQRLHALTSADPEQGRHLPADLAEHVKGCAACQVELRAATRLLGMLEGVAGDLEPQASPAEVAERAMTPLPKRAATPEPSRRFRPWLWIPVTAAAAVAATLLVVFALGERGSRAPGGGSGAPAGAGPASGPLQAASCERFRPGQAAATPCATGRLFEASQGERLRIALGDGTTLWVNHGSRVQLLPKARRALRLEAGQIFLDVVRQRGLPPLRVELPTGEVDVVGTQLQVLARRDLAVVDVVKGRVIARSGGKDEPVEAGREAILRSAQAPLVRAAADLGAATEWADAKLRVSEGTSGFGTLRAKRAGQKDETELALRLTDHKVTVRIQGSVARTEIEEAFHNDSAHTLEGIYKFPLPAEARIAGLDLLVDGKWEHGAVVERARGDKIWAGVIRNATPKKKRPVEQVEYIWVPGPWHDPALLKWKQGSEFELRIFPIPAKGERRVRIAYTETLSPIPGGRRYVLPLAADPAGRPRAERFTLEARVAGMPADLAVRTAPYDLQATSQGAAVSLRMEQTQFAPKGDLVIDVPEGNLDRELRAFAYRDSAGAGEGYALLSLRPDIPVERRGDALRVLFLVDRSYSTQQLRLGRAADLVGRVTRALGQGAQVQVLACATTCEALSPAFRAAGEDSAADLEARLRRLAPLGSTRLQHALGEAGKALRAAGAPASASRVIYLGDGIPTVGETEPGRLAALAKTHLPGARLTTVSLGGQVDEVVLRSLASAGEGAYISHGPASPMGATALRVLQRQLGEPLRGAALTLPEGLNDVAPAALGVLWPGEERLVLARLVGDVTGRITLRGTLGGAAFERHYEVALRPRPEAGNAFLPRLWAERRIDDLQREGGEARREEIVALSRRHHVLSRHTSLLVLESPAMAKAFGVEDTRPAVEWTGEAAAAEDESRDLSPRLGEDGKDRPAPMPAAKKSMAPRAATSSELDGLLDSGGRGGRAVDGAPLSPPRDEREMRPRPWRGRRMVRVAVRKVWYREAAIRGHQGQLLSDRMELQKRVAGLDAKPDSRERTRDLIRWHVRLGDLDAAERLANHWLEKDRLDAGALVELAAIAALRGDPMRSQELLASAVDVDPGSAEAHGRMVELYRAAGQVDLQCDHALARGLLAPPRWEHRVEAVRCTSERERFLALLSPPERRRAERALDAVVKKPPLWERLLIEATWDGGQDADVVVVSPRGRVLTWQGGAARTRSEEVRGLGREVLALSMEELGRYQVFVVPRAPAPGAAPAALQGKVKIQSYGKWRTLPFATAGKPSPVAEVTLAAKWRHERI